MIFLNAHSQKIMSYLKTYFLILVNHFLINNERRSTKDYFGSDLYNIL